MKKMFKVLFIFFIGIVVLIIALGIIIESQAPKDIAYYIPKDHFKNGNKLTINYSVKGAPKLSRNKDGYRIAWFDKNLTVNTSSPCLFEKYKKSQYYFYDENNNTASATYVASGGGVKTGQESGAVKSELFLKLK